MTYEEKIEHAIRLLQSIPQDGPIELCYSCGKDSDVIHLRLNPKRAAFLTNTILCYIATKGNFFSLQ